MRLFEHVSDRTVIVLLILLVVCTRLISFSYLFSLSANGSGTYRYPILAGDSSYYAHWASNILLLHAYEDPPGKPLHAAPPGYPALLAITKALTGNVTLIVVVQTILATFATVLIYRMARTLVPVLYALVPALVYAIDPMVAFTDSAIMTDGLFSSMLVCIVYLAFFQSRVQGMVRWSLAGVLLGGAIMIRPIAEFLILVFPTLYLLRGWIQGERLITSHLREMGVFLLGCALVITPWMIRNQMIFGAFEISPLGGHNLLMNNVRGFLAWRELYGTSGQLPAILVMRHSNDPVFLLVDSKINKGLADITPPGENTANYEGVLAARYIFHEPIKYTYFHIVNTIPFFLSSSIASYGQIVYQLRDNKGFFAPVTLSLLDALRHIRHPENIHSLMSAVVKTLPLVLEIFGWLLVTLIAILAAILRRQEFTVILCAVLVVYFAVLTGPMSNSRYRIPAEPYLLMLAVVGIQSLTVRARKEVI